MMAENGPKQGVPFHKHKNEDESFLVVEGTFEISVGDKTVVGAPGTYAFGPREIPHRWTNVGTGRGRIMNVFTPSGFEAMFYEIGLPIPDSAAPPPEILHRSSHGCLHWPRSTGIHEQVISSIRHRLARGSAIHGKVSTAKSACGK